MQISPLYSKAIDVYYQDLAGKARLGVTYEQGTRGAFRSLLDTLARPVGWTLVEELALPGKRKRPDGTLLDAFQIPRGYWEAKDTKDDLEAEIQKKITLGYDLRNTIFEDTRRAVLYQNRQRVLDTDLSKPDALAGLLHRYFDHTPAEIEEFHAAEREFRERIPTLAGALMSTLETARRENKAFVAAFAAFHEVCRTALNPDVRAAQIEEMLVQHLLTERLFRTVFDVSEFAKRNVIAAEIETVIDKLTSQSFSRAAFLSQLDYFYTAIESLARTITDFGEKQGFLNTIYERFFQGFSRDTADTHGIVYTPQPLVDFMCASVEHVLETQFGKSLSDTGVAILDPCTGTGNFLVNILRRIDPLDLRRKYKEELFANEVMLLPYYVASLNIEHAYFDIQGQYETFPGICFADTLDLAQGQQLALGFAERNTARVQREQDAAITVILGNPPYNVGQANENDNNKNRKYPIIDKRIAETYAKDSKATNKKALSDAYVKFFRWASDRLQGADGIVCYVTNNSFVDQAAFDGMRRHLLQDFTQVYHLDLHGNVRKNPKLSGTTHNVFGIQVGAGITVAVRRSSAERFIKYHRVPEDWRKTEKLAFLKEKGSIAGIDWRTLTPNVNNVWLTEGMQADWDSLLPLGTKEDKSSKTVDVHTVFKNYGRGVATCRDDWAFDFNKAALAAKMARFITHYNAEVERWKTRPDKSIRVDDFVTYDDTRLKWSETLKQNMTRGKRGDFDQQAMRPALYRPFCRQWLYFDPLINERVYQMPDIFPKPDTDNLALVVSDIAHRASFSVLATNIIPDLHLLAASDAFQCFPLYTYALNGVLRRDNITDWALAQFQAQYGASVNKRDIFHYVYALLHAPAYRERYKENLKRELPRIPFVPADCFTAFVEAGRALGALHIGYEQAEEYPLKSVRDATVPFTWRVTKMKLNPERTAVIVNPALTLTGIPPEAFEYRLGNRSAVEWVLDQYQVSVDKRSGITSDPNRVDDPEYIARLVRRVVTVSVETAKCVRGLPRLGAG